MGDVWGKATAKPRRPSRYTQGAKKKTPEIKLPGFMTGFNDNLFTAKDIPSRINDSYSEDYDILNVHNIVLSKLAHEKDSLPEKREQLARVQRILAETRPKIVERNKYLKEARDLEIEINSIEQEEKKKQYLEETSHLIEEYKRLGPIVKVVSFTATKEEMEEEVEDPHQEERLRIIQAYLSYAKKYISLNVVRIIPCNDRVCPACGHDLVLVDPEDYSMEKCEECGYEQMNFIPPTFLKESGSKGQGGSDYEDKENFLKALECYLGEQQKPRESLFIALDNWAKSYGHPEKEVIQQMPLNEDGTRGEYNKSMLLVALADAGYADNYKDIRLIGHLQWNWRLLSLSQQERDIIIKDYDATQAIFESIPKKRKSSLNAQYRLFRHLEARGHKVSPSEFKIPSSPGIIDEHDEFWREMIKAIPGATFVSLK